MRIGYVCWGCALGLARRHCPPSSRSVRVSALFGPFGQLLEQTHVPHVLQQTWRLRYQWLQVGLPIYLQNIVISRFAQACSPSGTMTIFRSF